MKRLPIVGSVQSQRTKFSNHKPTIVVADDDPSILDAMKTILELYNFQVETIVDGMVMPKLVSLQPKLLLLDICMSGVDGRDICKTLKTTETTKNIPVIMISASYDLASCLSESGADDFIAKPFEMQELLSKVNKYLLN
jgi:DNA-binding response OmpR family regulator